LDKVSPRLAVCHAEPSLPHRQFDVRWPFEAPYGRPDEMGPGEPHSTGPNGGGIQGAMVVREVGWDHHCYVGRSGLAKSMMCAILLRTFLILDPFPSPTG
jgi:hypothetical protein